jgi:hypothetical protein
MRQRRPILEQEESQRNRYTALQNQNARDLRQSLRYLWHKAIVAPLKFPKVVLLFSIMILVFLWLPRALNFLQQTQRPNKFPALQPIRRSTDAYDVFHCPEMPPLEGYPREYPILDVLRNWNTESTDPPESIYQGICVFDVAKSAPDDIQRQIRNYRAAEVPFVVRNDPAVLKSVDLWADPGYLSSKLHGRRYQATLSNTTKMTYYSLDPEYTVIPDDFVPWTRNVPMTYSEWYDQATNPRTHVKSVKGKYAYLRLDACLPDKKCDCNYRCNPEYIDDADFIYEDLPFFHPSPSSDPQPSSSSPSLYDVDMDKARGIQCRFGTPGLTVEAHFDNERNYIAMIGGARRYLLAHPRSCPNLHLYPQKHPLERHSRVDWSLMPNNKNKNTTTAEEFSNFDMATLNEVVLNAGDVLYLPTYWFHHIVSLTTVNYQCNTRSGYSVEYDQTIYNCGFFYDFPA